MVAPPARRGPSTRPSCASCQTAAATTRIKQQQAGMWTARQVWRPGIMMAFLNTSNIIVYIFKCRIIFEDLNCPEKSTTCVPKCGDDVKSFQNVSSQLLCAGEIIGLLLS